MVERIARHQNERPTNGRPSRRRALQTSRTPTRRRVVVDCLSLWVAHALMTDETLSARGARGSTRSLPPRAGDLPDDRRIQRSRFRHRPRQSARSFLPRSPRTRQPALRCWPIAVLGIRSPRELGTPSETLVRFRPRPSSRAPPPGPDTVSQAAVAERAATTLRPAGPSAPDTSPRGSRLAMVDHAEGRRRRGRVRCRSWRHRRGRERVPRRGDPGDGRRDGSGCAT